MDGDLQHDETKLAPMLRAIEDGADLVVGSRRAEGGDSAGLSSEWRRLLSDTGIRLAQRVLPLRLSDPMSGFFMLPRPLFEEIAPSLTGQGFKILLDLALSAPPRLRVVEIPFRFTPRVAGESKLDILVLAQFGALLLDKLFGGLLPLRFLSFAAVGALGVLVHLAVLTGLRATVAISFEAAQVAATLVAMIFNFQLNNLVTYRDQRLRGGRFWRGRWSSACLRNWRGRQCRHRAGALPGPCGMERVRCNRRGDRRRVELRGLRDPGLASPVTAWALTLAALTVVRLTVAAVTPLSPDEAYYWVWSRALAPGYLDHPPMVALWIRAGTLVAGDTALGIRLLAPFSLALGSWMIAQSADILFPGRRAGLTAAALLNATLLFGIGAVTMTPDTPLLFFWTRNAVALARLLRGWAGRLVRGGRARGGMRGGQQVYRHLPAGRRLPLAPGIAPMRLWLLRPAPGSPLGRRARVPARRAPGTPRMVGRALPSRAAGRATGSRGGRCSSSAN